MTSTDENPSPPPVNEGRNLYLFLGGMTLLGLLLAFVLFGGQTRSETGELGADGVESATPAVNLVATPSDINNVEAGQVAPDFGLVDLTGEVRRLSDFRGQAVIINFWASWCAPCVIEMPELQSVYEERGEEGLVILAVNREEDEVVVDRFFNERMGLTFTALLDSTGSVAGTYGVFNMPTTYFVDGSGVVREVHRGPMTVGQIEDYLAGLES